MATPVITAYSTIRDFYIFPNISGIPVSFVRPRVMYPACEGQEADLGRHPDGGSVWPNLLRVGNNGGVEAIPPLSPRRLMIQSVCVFCGSAPGVHEEHMGAASSLGALLADRGIQLVYGGARVGLMGAVADGALARGGRVVGVMPRGLERYEVAHRGLTELVWTEDLHERKRRMAERSDAFVILPGGYGTLEEALEVISWKQMRMHEKPIVLLDTRGFFQPLAALAESVVQHGFAYAPAHALFTLVSRTEEILPALGLDSAPRAVGE
jgi:uncharacterized protein (TIGR00730 family)